MKRFTKILVSLMLAVIMSMSVFMLAACTEEVGNNSGSDTPTSTSASAGNTNSGSGGSGGNSGSGDNTGSNSGGTNPTPGGDDYEFQAEDRSAYTFGGAVGVYMTASLYDVMTASQTQSGLMSMLKGYRLGDVYNAALDMALTSDQSMSPDTLVVDATRLWYVFAAAT